MDAESVLPPAEERFYIELEFLQNMANPHYLHYLSRNGYFDDPQFMSFLVYMQYWKAPEYKKCIMFPQSLLFLDEILANAQFRKELSVPMFINYIETQQLAFWSGRRTFSKDV
jgi:mediator of RNA polymerase II transcription subunit 31